MLRRVLQAVVVHPRIEKVEVTNDGELRNRNDRRLDLEAAGDRAAVVPALLIHALREANLVGLEVRPEQRLKKKIQKFGNAQKL